jgi:hypothetical protein
MKIEDNEEDEMMNEPIWMVAILQLTFKFGDNGP